MKNYSDQTALNDAVLYSKPLHCSTIIREASSEADGNTYGDPWPEIMQGVRGLGTPCPEWASTHV